MSPKLDIKKTVYNDAKNNIWLNKLSQVTQPRRDSQNLKNLENFENMGETQNTEKYGNLSLKPIDREIVRQKLLQRNPKVGDSTCKSRTSILMKDNSKKAIGKLMNKWFKNFSKFKRNGVTNERYAAEQIRKLIQKHKAN